jgi:hypothetical protein
MIHATKSRHHYDLFFPARSRGVPFQRPDRHSSVTALKHRPDLIPSVHRSIRFPSFSRASRLMQVSVIAPNQIPCEGRRLSSTPLFPKA